MKIKPYLAALSMATLLNPAQASFTGAEICDCLYNNEVITRQLSALCTNFTAATGDSSYDTLDYISGSSSLSIISGNIVVLTTAGLAVYKYRKNIAQAWKAHSTSSEEMDIAEVLPATMEQKYFNLLKVIDEILSPDGAEGSKEEWRKAPIYGAFPHSKKGWMDSLTGWWQSNVADQYLYGYAYEKGDYLVEITRFFSRKDLPDLSLRDFHKINPKFQHTKKGIYKKPHFISYVPSLEENENEGKDVEEGTRSTAHPHITKKSKAQTKGNLAEVNHFMNTFLQKGHLLKEAVPYYNRRHNPFAKIIKGLHNNRDIKAILTPLLSSSKDSTLFKTHLYFIFSSDLLHQENYEIALRITHLTWGQPTYKAKSPAGSLLVQEGAPSFLSFTRAPHKEEGDSWLSAIGITLEEGIGQLENAVGNKHVREIVAPEIVKSFFEGTYQEELAPFLGGISLGEEEDYRTLLRSAMKKKVYRTYVNAFKEAERGIKGWLTHSPNNTHGGEESIGDTGLYDALAYLNECNLYIWQNTLSNHLDLIRSFEGNPGFKAVHILHTLGNHYDQLIVAQESQSQVSQESGISQLRKGKEKKGQESKKNTTNTLDKESKPSDLKNNGS
jgi:hypothetical protein